MNRNLIIGAAVGVLLIAAGGGLYLNMRGKGSAPSSPAASSQVNSDAAVQEDQQKSLKDLLSSTSPQECNFSTKSPEGEVTGVVRTANGKVRGEFSTVASNQNIKSNIIVDGKTSYMWVEGMKTGYKFSVDEAKVQAQATGSAKQNVDINQKFDVDCKAWGVDNNKFILPSDIKFTDLSAAVNTSTSVSGGADKCAVCNNVPEDAKAQCLAALGCK